MDGLPAAQKSRHKHEAHLRQIQHKHLWLFGLIAALLLAACTAAPALATPTATQKPVKPTMTWTPVKPATQTPARTVTPAATRTTTHTSTPTPTVLLSPTPLTFLKLPAGSYLLFQEGNWVDAVSMDKVITRHLVELAKDEVASLTSDKKHLLVQPAQAGSPKLINLTDLTVTELALPQVLACLHFDLSPDGKTLLQDCQADTTREIYALAIDANEITRLTDCGHTNDNCADPTWSPDGKWIAFYRSAISAPQTQSNGTELLDPNCLSTRKTCSIYQNEFDIQPPYSWSPDSFFLVGHSPSNAINIYQNLNGVLFVYKAIKPVISSLNQRGIYSWTSDDQWIAFLDSDGLYMGKVDTDERKQLGSLDKDTLATAGLIGWVKLPVQ